MSDDREKVFKLELRLQDGFAMIGEAMNKGLEVENWERHWIELLREFEQLSDDLADVAISDELAATPPEQQPMELGRIERAA